MLYKCLHNEDTVTNFIFFPVHQRGAAGGGFEGAEGRQRQCQPTAGLARERVRRLGETHQRNRCQTIDEGHFLIESALSVLNFTRTVSICSLVE